MILGLIATAYAQTATATPDSTTIDPGTQVVGWVCSNQTTVAWVFTAFLARFGISSLSAILKKFGVTQDSPVIGYLIPIIKLIALDFKPPDHVIVQNAQAIVGPSVIPDSVVAAVKANGAPPPSNVS